MLNECDCVEAIAADVDSSGGDDDGVIWTFESLNTGLNFVISSSEKL